MAKKRRPKSSEIRRVREKLSTHQAEEPTPALLVAAEEFGVDLANPDQRAMLLNALASLMYGESTRGRPPGSENWDSRQLAILQCLASLIEAKNPNVSDRQAADELIKKFPKVYGHIANPDTLRLLLPRAKRKVSSIIDSGEPKYIAQGLEWFSQAKQTKLADAAQLMQLATTQLSELVSKYESVARDAGVSPTEIQSEVQKDVSLKRFSDTCSSILSSFVDMPMKPGPKLEEKRESALQMFNELSTHIDKIMADHQDAASALGIDKLRDVLGHLKKVVGGEG
jgi:hypothetical protein